MMIPVGRIEQASVSPGWRRAALGVLAIGVGLRLVLWLQNPALWFDEVAVALGVLERDAGELLGRLGRAQVASPGFLLTTKALVAVAGDGELVLRLPSLLAGVLALFLMHDLARCVLPAPAATAALALFAVAHPAVFYSAQVKPYSIDLAVALMLTCAAWRIVRRFATPGAAAASAWGWLVACGAVGLWFSLPAVFVVAGLWCGLGAVALYRRARGVATPLSIAFVVWAGSFAALYLVHLRHSLGDAWLVEFWGGSGEPGSPVDGAFAPLGASLSEAVRWTGAAIIGLFDRVAYLQWPGLGVFLFSVGVGWALLRRRALVALLLLPPSMALVASALRLYPFFGRLMLFALPALLIFAGMGLAVIARARPAGRWIALALFIAVLIGPARRAARGAWLGPTRPEVRAALHDLVSDRLPGEPLYVSRGAALLWSFYAPRVGVGQQDVILGGPPGTERDDIERLCEAGGGRAWMLVAHALARDERTLRGAVADHGSVLEERRFGSAWLWCCSLTTR